MKLLHLSLIAALNAGLIHPSISMEEGHSPQITKKKPDEIDKEYYKFMGKLVPGYDKNIENDIKYIGDIKKYFAEKGLNTENPEFFEGKYAQPTWSLPFWYQDLDPNFDKFNPHAQGWKLHITAMPQSARKIAELVLPRIKGLPGQKGKQVSYKIISSIPHLRTLWGYANVKGQESQAGKFLVIYSDNAQHAYYLAREIDKVLSEALLKKELVPSDFFPLVGDARVGKSGGVYVRYGAYKTHDVKKVSPIDKTMPPDQISGAYTEDNRFYPWPDFMNKKNKFWKEHESPFRELPIYWQSYYNPKQKVLSWNNRPNSWNDIAESDEEKKEIKQSMNLDRKLEEIAKKLQEQTDYILAKKLSQDEENIEAQRQQQIKEDERLARAMSEEQEEGERPYYTIKTTGEKIPSRKILEKASMLFDQLIVRIKDKTYVVDDYKKELIPWDEKQSKESDNKSTKEAKNTRPDITFHKIVQVCNNTGSTLRDYQMDALNKAWNSYSKDRNMFLTAVDKLAKDKIILGRHAAAIKKLWLNY